MPIYLYLYLVSFLPLLEFLHRDDGQARHLPFKIVSVPVPCEIKGTVHIKYFQVHYERYPITWKTHEEIIRNA